MATVRYLVKDIPRSIVFYTTLAMTQLPSTAIMVSPSTKIGLAWFLGLESGTITGVFKDGGVAGFSTLVKFVASPQPGIVTSPAGAIIMVNRSVPLGDTMKEILRAMGAPSTVDIITPEIDAATASATG